MDILQAAQILRPGTAWTLRGDALEQADDGTPRVVVPSLAELQMCMQSDPLAYQDLRRPEYPVLADQLDALWKGGEAAEAMRLQIMAVKAKYPKPE